MTSRVKKPLDAQIGKPAEASNGGSIVDKAFRTLLLPVCLILAFLLSCFTTHQGIADIIKDEYAAWCFTIVVQLLLVFCSWNLGKSIGAFIVGDTVETASAGAMASVVRNGFFIFIFLMAFVVSVFFSFSYYFTTIFGLKGEGLVRQNLPNTLISQIVPGLTEKVQLAEQEQSSGVVKGEAKSWLDGVVNVMEAAERNKPVIKASFDKRIAEARDLERAAQQERDEAQRSALDARSKVETEIIKTQGRKADLEANLRSSSNRLNDAKRERDVLLSETVQPLREKRAAAEEIMRGEDTGLIPGSKSGKGPKFKAAQSEFNKLSAQLKPYEDRVRALDGQIRSLETSVSREQAELATLPGTIQSFQSQLPSAPSGGETTRQIGGADAIKARSEETLLSLDEFIAETKALESRFRSAASKDNYDNLVNACRKLLNPLVEVQKANDLQCEENATLQAVVSLDQRRGDWEVARGNFQQKCIGQKAKESLASVITDEKTAKDAATTGLGGADLLMGECIQIAGAAGVDASEWQAKLNAFVETKSLNRDRFSITLSAPTTGFYQFLIGIFMSFAQDLLILALGVFWEIDKLQKDRSITRAGTRKIGPDVSENPEDSNQIAAAKAILRLADSRANKSVIDVYSEAWHDLNPATKSNATALLNQFVRDRLARRTGQGFQITPEGLRELQEELTTYAPAAPPAPPPARSAPRAAAASAAASAAADEPGFETTTDGRRKAAPRPKLVRNKDVAAR